MIVNHTIHHPFRAADGEPYAVRISTPAITIEVPAWTQEEAGDIRDTALDQGYSARILGLPARLAAAGFPTHTGLLPNIED